MIPEYGEMVKSLRKYTLLDSLLMNFDEGLRTVFGGRHEAYRENPAMNQAEPRLSKKQREQVAGLIRVNHSGEVCAQALYNSQALTARSSDLRATMKHSADEENDHLAWCEDRLAELKSHTSYLNLLWYLGSFCIGATAGVIGDKWSLGFVVETERQVVKHLQDQKKRLPKEDTKSHAIIDQMEEDEMHHASVALENGANELPDFIKAAMQAVSKVMTKTAYWI